ncbi:hypothetical protein JS562_13395 [Agrobacterium sp. S2]|nr:hypothetical protein [Agrobacterium sp. S2]
MKPITAKVGLLGPPYRWEFNPDRNAIVIELPFDAPAEPILTARPAISSADATFNSNSVGVRRGCEYAAIAKPVSDGARRIVSL